MRALDEEHLIAQTLGWMDGFIIKHNLCPFAAAARSHTRTVVCHDGVQNACDFVEAEVRRLRAKPAQDPATTLIVLPRLTNSFADLMELQEVATHRVHMNPRDAAIQLLAFHPHAEFDDMPKDPADVALRSPWPLIHLLRDADVSAAEDRWMAVHGAPPAIQERNAAYLRGIGFEAAVAAAAEAAASVAGASPPQAGVEPTDGPAST